MKVELRIDPGCDGMSVVINAPALTDEVKALAARLVNRHIRHDVLLIIIFIFKVSIKSH